MTFAVPWLYCCIGQDGNLCVYEVAQTYLPIKYLSTTNQQQPGCMAVSPDSTLLATVSHTGTPSVVGPCTGHVLGALSESRHVQL